jgi:type IV pilus assembly protein PilC
MPLLLTPGHFTQRAELYHQLAQLTSAGLGLVQSLEQVRRNPPARSFRAPVEHLLRQLAQGYTFTESLHRINPWLPAFDIALIQAGEHSGRLDQCFRLLANYYTDRARIARQVIADLAYPAFLFHFAVFILPFPKFFQTWNVTAYLTQTLGVLLPIYAVTFLLIYAAQSKHGEHWRAIVESLVHPVPMLGTARWYLALARLAASLEALISAGVSIIEAWELAATASGSPALRRTVRAWKPALLAGSTPAEVVNTSPRFPQLFANQYASGEISGKLDETLRRLHQYYQEEGTRKLHAVAQWTPRFVYLIVMFLIAYRVIQFWTGHFRDINNAINF